MRDIRKTIIIKGGTESWSCYKKVDGRGFMEGLWFPDYLRELNMASIALRFLVCIICGGIIGIEREWKHRTAGFKTHILVCLGSAVCMMTGQYIAAYFKMASIDPSRIGAQVVSGIGFLGVGTIIVTKNAKVKGLTTAAGLWVSACIGLAVGIGFFEIAIIGTLCVEVLFLIVKQLNVFGVVRETRIFLYVEISDVSHVKDLMALLRENECSVFSMDMHHSNRTEENTVGVIFGIRGSESTGESVIALVSEQDYVLCFEEMENQE